MNSEPAVSRVAPPTKRAGKHKVGEVVEMDLDRVITVSNYREIDRESDDFNAFLEDVRVNKQQVPALIYWHGARKIWAVKEGNKRRLAAEILGRKLLAIIVEEPGEAELLVDQLRLNGHRSDGNQLEIARAYARVMELKGFSTNKELAELFNRSEATISKLLSILDLPEEGQQRIAAGGSVEGTLKLYAKKPRRQKGHGKKRSLSLGGGKTVLLTARRPVEDDLAIEMLTDALRIFSASRAITQEDLTDVPSPVELKIAELVEEEAA